MVNLEEIPKLKVAELKQELTAAGLPTNGVKNDLVQRLLDHLKKSADTSVVIAAPAPLPTEVNASSGVVAGTISDVVASSTSIATDTETIAALEDKAVASLGEKTALVTEEERKKARAQRFGIPLSDVDRAKIRAQRFGAGKVAQPAASKVASAQLANVTHEALQDAERLKKRTERFKTESVLLNTLEDEEKKRKRLQKFGGQTIPDDNDETKKQRLNKFKSPLEAEEEAKRAARLARFNTAS